MNTDNGRISFGVELDNSKLRRQRQEASSEIERLGDSAANAGDRMDAAVSKIGKSLASLGAAWSASGFVKRIMDTRGEFQKLEVAFKTMLGSADKANTLMQQLVRTAAITPFDLKGVADGAKQLLAYGTAADEVNDTLIHLGDIAAGLSLPLGDLVYLYGTTMTQGRMYTQDLRQFMGRGIPLAEELAKQFGVTKDKVGELVTAGKVGAAEFKQAIMSLSSEGGKFGGLMEEQSKTITGQISNIEDAIDTMFNSIGKSKEGIINGALSGVSALVENYERVGRTLLSLVGVYGAYKVSLMVVAAAEKVKSVVMSEAAVQQGLAAMAGHTLSTAQSVAAAKTVILNNAMRTLNATMKSNVFVLVASAVAALVVALASAKTQTERVRDAYKRYNEELDEAKRKQDDLRAAVQKNLTMAEDEELITENRITALKMLAAQYPSIFDKYETEYDWLKNLKQIKQEIAELDAKGDVTSTNNQLKDVDKRIKELEKKDNATYTTGSSNAGAFTVKTGTGLTADETAELKMLKQQRTALQKQQKKDQANAYLTNLSNVSDKDIQKQITERKNIIAAMDLNNKRYGNVRQGGAKGVFTKEELEGQLTLLQTEQKNRKAPKYTSSEYRSKLNKDLTTAQKALSDFDKSSDRLTELERMTQRQSLVDKVEQAQKALEDYTKGTPKGSGKGGSKSAAEREEDTQKIATDRIKAAQELEAKVADARIAAMADGEDKISAQRAEQNKRELDELELQKQEAINKYVEDERKLYEAKVGKGFDAKSVDTSAISKQYDYLISQKQEQQKRDAQKEAIQSMLDYMQKYGSFEQQKRATTEEYEGRINNATTEGERMSLQKERDQKLASLEYESIAAGIDWKALFSGVGNLSTEMMKPMLEQLTAFTKTDQYRNADSQTQQDVAGLIQELQKYLGTDQSVTWENLAQAMEDFTTAVGRYNEAVTKEKEANERLSQGKKDLKAGNITQKEYDQMRREADEFGEATRLAKEEMTGFASTLNETSDEIANRVYPLMKDMTNAKTWQGVSGFGELQGSVGQAQSLTNALDLVLPKMTDGLGKTIASGISSGLGGALDVKSMFSSTLGTVVGAIAQIPQMILGMISSIKSMVTGILDSFTELISLRWIDDLVTSVCESIGNLVNAIFDLPENLVNVLEGVVTGVGDLLNNIVGRVANVLTLGLLSSDGPAAWFQNSNAKMVAETIESLTDENKILEQSIEDLTDKMEKSRGAEAIDISSRAAELQRQTDANYKAIAQAQAGYHGSHHSWNYYWGGFTEEQIARLSNQMGREWSGDLWDLTPEEMKKLRSNVDMWKAIKNTGEGGYGDRLAEKLEDYIEQAGELEEITEQLYENLTTKTEDNVFDEFLDSLYDLAEESGDVFSDIADNWQDMVNKMVINNLIGEKFQSKIKAWYEDLAKLNEEKTKDGSTMTNREYRLMLDELKTQYEDYVRDAQEQVEFLRDEGIIQATEGSGTATSTVNSAMSVTEDTANELVGRMTAMQMEVRGMGLSLSAIGQTLSASNGMTAQISQNTDEMRNLSLLALDHLETISKNTHELYQINERLGKIEQNTRDL